MCLFASNISKINFENPWSHTIFDNFNNLSLWYKKENKNITVGTEDTKVCKKDKSNQNYCLEGR